MTQRPVATLSSNARYSLFRMGDLCIRNGDVVESMMSGEEDDLALKYCQINRSIMEECRRA